MTWDVRLAARTLHLARDDDAARWSCDGRGRLLAGRRGRLHVRLGLDGSAVARRQLARGVYGPPRRLSPRQAEALLDAVAADARAALADPRLTAAPPAALRGLEALAGRDGAWLRAERQRFACVYRAVPILPPDCGQALVVQLTEGCSWGRCTFCQLYRGTPFRARDEAALEAHLAGIAGLLGEAAALRRGVFLGDANALLLPQERLLRAIERVRARFPGPAATGLHSFVDAFTPPGKSEPELAALRAAGLRRVTLGLESGHAPLLSWLDKPARPDGALELAHRARAAGLPLGVVVLVGAGGRRFAAAHLEDTVALVERMSLGRDDLVFLSPLRVAPDGEYARRAAAEGIAPLDPRALRDELERFERALAGQGARVVPYELDRFVY